MTGTVQDALGFGTPCILDGGMGTELQRRGVPMDGLLWSATALESHPDVVRELHEDYIRAGADVIVANTFACSPAVLEASGMGLDGARLNRRAVELAIEARGRAAGGRAVFVAGSMSSFAPGLDYRHRPSRERMAEGYREQAAVMAEAGADLIVLEMMLWTGQTNDALASAAATGLPAWLGFSCSTDRASGVVHMFDRPDIPAFDEVLSRTSLDQADAIFIMHTDVADIAPALAVLRGHWDGPVGVYAHSGDFEMPVWDFGSTITPSDYAARAREWVDAGAVAVGGCCGTGPAHIRALKREF